MIDKLLASLNAIEVHGKENLDILLGCIFALEQMREEQNKEEDKDNGESVD